MAFEDSFLSRLVVVGLAAGIVTIGAFPYRHKLDNFIHKFSRNSAVVSAKEPKEVKDLKGYRFDLSLGEKVKVITKSSGAEGEITSRESKGLGDWFLDKIDRATTKLETMFGHEKGKEKS